MNEWEKIVGAFWSKYHWDERWCEILCNQRQKVVRRSISKPTLQRHYWAVSLRPLHFDTHDGAIKYAMGLVVLEDLLSEILREQKPPEEVDK
jgi:hypothetical protein